MTRLLCNGVALDLYDEAGLQFTHKNPLFAFDNLECERTTQFKLPCTKTNDALLSLARVPAYAGTGMRQRFTAQLQDGVTVKNGYLYVSNYDGKDYAAIFVTGELVGLQAIKNLGTLAEIMSFTNKETLGGSSVAPSAATNDIWKNVLYKYPTGELLRPSIQLNELYNAVCTAHSITAQPLPASVAGVRIIPDKMNGIQETSISFTATASSMATDGTHPVCDKANAGTLDYMFTLQNARVMRRVGDNPPYTVYTGTVQQLKCNQKTTIKFPDNWDDDLFIGYFLDGDSFSVGEFSFYGDRSFDENHVVTGQSLKGLEVTIEQGDAFMIISKSDYINEMTSSGLALGWGFQNLSCSFTVSGEVDGSGAFVRLQDNMPDMTFTDLLKAVAALAGCVLNYTDANGLIFEPLVLSGYTQHVLKNITKRSEVQRTFSDYVQNNIVRFEGAPSRGQAIAYTIQNDNLDSEKELQVIPFSDGLSQDGLLFVPKDVDKPTVGDDGGDASLSAMTLPKNAGVQTLCNASTQFKVEARMTMAEYNEITAKTLLLVDNTLYIWTERSWQKNTGKFTLAKV